MKNTLRHILDNKETLALLMVGYLCFAWGTTYLGVKIAIRSMPIFMMAGLREGLAGFLLFLLSMLVEKPRRYSPVSIVRQGVYGFGFFTATRGLMALALFYIQSGLVALIFSLIPVYVLFLNAFVGKFYFNRLIGLGLALGALGMFLTFRDSLAAIGTGAGVLGIIIALLAALSWAGTSVLMAGKREELPPLFRSSMQLLFGAAGLGFVSLLRGETVALGAVAVEAWLAIVYLAVFGSVAGFMAFGVAIRYLPVARATLYAYLNPFVALFLGWLVLGEPMSLALIGAFTLTLAGVYLVNRGYRRRIELVE